MKYLSVCSGIEAATVAWHPLGWAPAAFSEIEAFPRAVLAHHYPEVPCHGDFTTIGADDYGPIDLLVGGTPCQSFSVAGLRGGMADDRGNLALEYLRLADRKRPEWLVWENVPGVLSSNEGRDFGSFLGALGELGYGFAYRVLDAQFFGVAQRRRRVFVVGYLGDWRRAAAVLFERHSLQGHPPPRGKTGQGIAGGAGEGFAFSGQSLTAGDIDGVAPTLDTGAEHHNRGIHVAHSLRAEGFDASEDGTGRGTPLVPVAFAQNTRDEVRYIGGNIAGALAAEPGMKQQTYIAFSAKDHGADAMDDCSPTLRAGGHSGSHANAGVMPAVAFNTRQDPIFGDVAQPIGAKDNGNGVAFADCFNGQVTGETAPTMGMRGSSTNSSGPTLMQAKAVRRLTPRECERLQGFPDDYTLVPYREKLAADGPRYKALGNSMAVPVMRWIGDRISLVSSLVEQREAA